MFIAEKAFATLLSTSVLRRFSKGSTILYQGEVPRSAYIIHKGIVKVYTIGHMGEEQIVTFNVAGEIIPATWLTTRTATALYYYEALTDCELHSIPYDALNEFVASDPEVERGLMEYYMHAYLTSLMRITALEQAKASDKIMYTLYYLIARYGREIRKDSYIIEIVLTQQLISSLVGLTRETASIELNKLKKSKVIEYRERKYIVDKAMLTKRMGEDNFRDLIG
jgi:CRP/FNR family transcriptional regulator